MMKDIKINISYNCCINLELFETGENIKKIFSSERSNVEMIETGEKLKESNIN
jgi:hypothetical protein